MKLIIKKDALESAMKKIGGVYGQMPKKDAAVIVLQAVVGKKGEGVFKGLTITMSNGSSQVATNIFLEMSSDIPENTSLSVGGELVGAVNALAGVKGEHYTISENGGSIVVAVGDNSVTLSKKVEGVMPVAFDIKNPDVGIEGKVMLEGKSFKGAVAKILFAALSDDEKAIGGVAVKCTTDGISFRATDSFRLAQSSIGTQATAEFDFVVSPSVLKLIVATVSNDKVVMIKTEKHLLVQVGNDLWQVALLDKKYPHRIFEDMQKMDRGTIITANKAELLVALDIVSVSAKEGIVTFEVDGDKLVAFGEGRVAKATFTYEADGELPGAITFSNKFFKQCLMAYEGEKVSFSTKKVALFSAEGEGLFVGLCSVAGK